MSYKVAIRNNATGEVRIATQDVPWRGEKSAKFWWLEGNMSCDCNRELEFIRAAGPGPAHDPFHNDIETECSDGRFSVLYAQLDNGERVEMEK